MDTFHSSLNSNSKPIVDNTVGGALMECTFADVVVILDILTKKIELDIPGILR